jgi:hypothetical protein
MWRDGSLEHLPAGFAGVWVISPSLMSEGGK